MPLKSCNFLLGRSKTSDGNCEMCKILNGKYVPLPGISDCTKADLLCLKEETDCLGQALGLAVCIVLPFSEPNPTNCVPHLFLWLFPGD